MIANLIVNPIISQLFHKCCFIDKMFFNCVDNNADLLSLKTTSLRLN